MKRKLVAAILGIAASVAMVSSAHAQGRVFFNNYGNTTGPSPIVYGPGSNGAVGTGVNSTYTAGLWYFLGTATLPAGGGSGDALPTGWELASVTQQINAGATAGPSGVGLFSGPIATISDYVSGPITFSVIAYNGSSFGASTDNGNSAGFTLPSIATGTSPTGEFGPALAGFSVLPVPEPSIFALSGLGAAALMLVRRKK